MNNGECIDSSPDWRYSALFATGCEKLKARDHLNKGVQAFKTAKYNAGSRALQGSGPTGSRISDRTPVSGHGLHEPVHSGRGIAGESAERTSRRAGIPEGARKGSEEHCRNQFAGLVCITTRPGQPAAGKENEQLDEAKKWYTKLAEVDPNNKEAYYSLGCHHLGEVVSGVDGSPREAWA